MSRLLEMARCAAEKEGKNIFRPKILDPRLIWVERIVKVTVGVAGGMMGIGVARLLGLI